MITENNNFLMLVEKAMAIQGRTTIRPVIEKELLHYDILFALDSAGLLDDLTFQGGTSLRLCYGASRFSEDLDFVGGNNFNIKNLMNMKNCLEEYLGKRYGLEVSVKEPKDLANEINFKNVKVNIWQLRLVTHPERKDFPKQMIKIEVANIPAYTREPLQVLHNYDFLPDGYNDVILMVETLDEIFSDKIVAFVNCQSYVRHRDIWDLHWLQQRGCTVQKDMIIRKITDYKIDDYEVKLSNMINHLNSIIFGKEFKEQMSRFLPMDVQERTLMKDKFLILLEKEMLRMLKLVESIF